MSSVRRWLIADIRSAAHRVHWPGCVVVLWIAVGGYAIDITPWVFAQLVGLNRFEDYEVHLSTFAVTNLTGAACAAVLVIVLRRYEFWLLPLFCGALFSVGVLNAMLTVVGFANFAWHLILAGFGAVTLLGSLYIETLDVAIRETPTTDREALSSYKAELWSAIRIVVQVVLGFVAVLGVAVSILFGNEGFRDVGNTAVGVQLGVGMAVVAGVPYLALFGRLAGGVRYLRSQGL